MHILAQGCLHFVCHAGRRNRPRASPFLKRRVTKDLAPSFDIRISPKLRSPEPSAPPCTCANCRSSICTGCNLFIGGWVLLLPPALQEWLPEGHLALFISDVVDEAMDLTHILATYDTGDGRGQPPL